MSVGRLSLIGAIEARLDGNDSASFSDVIVQLLYRRVHLQACYIRHARLCQFAAFATVADRVTCFFFPLSMSPPMLGQISNSLLRWSAAVEVV